MGIRGGVYIANEQATENAWKKLDGLINKISIMRKDKNKIDNEVSLLECELNVIDNQIKDLDPASVKIVNLQDRKSEIETKLAIKEQSTKLDSYISNVTEEIKSILEDIYPKSASV